MDAYTRLACVLTAYAESDFRDWVTQMGDDGTLSYGVFQQKPRWWSSALLGTAAQANAFLDQFRTRTGDLVNDCWLVQRWSPSERYDSTSRESTNYLTRVSEAKWIVATRKLQ